MGKKSKKLTPEPYAFQQLKIITDLKIHEKILSGIFKIFGYGIGFLTSLPWVSVSGLTNKPDICRDQSYCYEEDGEKVYRRIEAKDELAFDLDGLQTITEIVLNSLRSNLNRLIMGFRPLISEHEIIEDKASKTVFELDAYEWLSCGKVLDRISSACEFLKGLDLNFDKKLVIFAETSQDWMIMALSVWLIRSVLVTVYSTLNDDSILHVMNLTAPVAIMVDRKTSGRLNKFIDKIPSIETIIYTSRCPHDIVQQSLPGKKLFHVDNIFAQSVDTNKVLDELPKPTPDDTILIMFTSGSTGTPKGIVMKHSNIVAVLAGVKTQVEYWRGHTLVSYLPLAHILELMCELAIITYGGKIGYANPATLFPNSPFLHKGCKNDLEALKPTCMAAVPMILERMYKTIMGKLKETSRLKQLFIQECYNLKARFRSHGHDTPIIDKLVFKKFRQIFGGNLQYMLIGGAYLSPELEEFYNILFNNFKQAYGATEVVCGGTMSNISYKRPNNIGPPLTCAEFKIIPWDEGGYTATGDIPRGEIVISGPAVCSGYYKSEEQTKAAFFTDPITNKQWYRTADIGEVLPDGCFRIIGRKSEIIKLSHGEYVELPKIESVITSSKYVDYCCATSSKDFSHLIAIICLNKPNVLSLVASMQLADIGEFEDYCKDPKVVDFIDADIKKMLKNANFNKFEIPKLLFTSDQWSPDSGLLTPSLKVRRAQVLVQYSSLIT